MKQVKLLNNENAIVALGGEEAGAAWSGRHPHHVEAGGQFEQDSAVLVQLLQRPVEQHDQIHVLLG